MHQYATTTPEARELVAELEFVWDQIKSNSASSTGSSPGHLGQSQALQQASMSGYGMRQATDIGRGGLRVLRPLSDGDEEEDDLEALEARTRVFERGDPANDAEAGRLPHSLDVHDRRWRKRVEQALVKMTVEIAALREQIEANTPYGVRRRRGLASWIIWLAWVSTRHLLVDAALVGLFIIYTGRKRDGRVEQWFRLLLLWAKAQIANLKMRRLTRTSKT